MPSHYVLERLVCIITFADNALRRKLVVCMTELKRTEVSMLVTELTRTEVSMLVSSCKGLMSSLHEKPESLRLFTKGGDGINKRGACLPDPALPLTSCPF